MTLQEIFDKAVAGLAAQGFTQALDAEGSCVYRAPDGGKCALGQVMSDAEYSPRFEYEPAGRLVGSVAWVTRDNANKLVLLQQCHDYGDTPQKMRGALRSFATNYGLTLPAVLQEKEDEA